MIEFYWAYATFVDLMDLTQELFCGLATAVNGTHLVEYQGSVIDLRDGWVRMPFHESLEKIGGVSPDVYLDYGKCKDLALKLGEAVHPKEKLGKLQAKLFDNLATDISPLSRKNDANPDITDRFELFICGQEMANAFSELNDPYDQKDRFEEQVREKAAGDDEAHAMDED